MQWLHFAVHADTRRTCRSLLALLDVHPRVGMQILGYSQVGLTMEGVHREVPGIQPPGEKSKAPPTGLTAVSMHVMS